MEQAVAPAHHVVSETEAIYDRIALRIMPFLVLLFVVAWLHRINVGFARLQMATFGRARLSTSFTDHTAALLLTLINCLPTTIG